MNEVEAEVHEKVMELSTRGYHPIASNVDTRTTKDGMVAQLTIVYRKDKEPKPEAE